MVAEWHAGGSEALVVVKDTGGSEMARLRPSWGRLGCIGSEEVGGKREVTLGIGGVVGDIAGVRDRVGRGTARSEGIWRKLGSGNRA